MIVTAEDFVPGREPGMSPAPASFLRPDGSGVFARRASRLRRLADGHPMAGFLGFVAGLAEIQHGLTASDWREALPLILAEVAKAPATAEVARAAHHLMAEGPDHIAGRAGRWLNGEPTTDDLAASPFIVAALQAARIRAAATATPLGTETDPGRCPLCGGAPVAATIATQGGIAGVRYLHCCLCATAWHLERLRCPRCGSDGKVTFRHLDGYGVEVKAETCGDCGTYVKVFATDGHPEVEPLADDLASMALDLHLAEDGWRRLWPNPFLHGA